MYKSEDEWSARKLEDQVSPEKPKKVCVVARERRSGRLGAKQWQQKVAGVPHRYRLVECFKRLKENFGRRKHSACQKNTRATQLQPVTGMDIAG